MWIRSSGIHLQLHLQPECNLFSFDWFYFMEPWTLTVEISFKKQNKTVTGFHKLSSTILKIFKYKKCRSFATDFEAIIFTWDSNIHWK